jgi:hypothetical protein
MCVRKTVFLIPVPKNSLPEPKNFREHCHKSTPHTQTHTDTQRQRTHTQPPRVSTSRACSTRLALIAKNVSLRRASAPCPHAASCVVTLSPSLSFVCVGSVTQRVEHMVSVHFFVASRERTRGLRRQSTHCAPWPAYRVRTRTQKRLCVGDLLPYALAAFVRRGHS